MDTVKLDIQKLQLLNDRITQVLEALNQVRLSVHGLQQSQGGMQGGISQGLQHSSVGQGMPFGGIGGVGMGGGGINPYQQVGQAPWQQNVTGMQQSPFAQQQSPFGQQGLQHSSFGQGVPFGGQQGVGGGGGIDPTWQIRAAQTFPFAQLPYPGGY